jgi:predicted DNA-binding protein
MQNDSLWTIKPMSKDDNRVNPYPIRLPPPLRKRLEAIAKANGRSLNAEMLLRLEASLDGQDGFVVSDELEARMREIAKEEAQKALKKILKNT